MTKPFLILALLLLPILGHSRYVAPPIWKMIKVSDTVVSGEIIELKYSTYLLSVENEEGKKVGEIEILYFRNWTCSR